MVFVKVVVFQNIAPRADLPFHAIYQLKIGNSTRAAQFWENSRVCQFIFVKTKAFFKCICAMMQVVMLSQMVLLEQLNLN